MKRLTVMALMALLLDISGFLCKASDYSEASLDVSPGSLGEKLRTEQLDGIQLLRLTGKADVRDFRSLAANFPASVAALDLEKLDIVSYVYPRPQPEGPRGYQDSCLPAWSFFSLPVRELVLPASLKSIDEGAMAGCGLKSVTLPEGLVSVGEYAFYGCCSLEDVKFPASLVTIGKGAFSDCKTLKAADLTPTSLTLLPEECFSGGSALESVSLPGSLKSIGPLALRGTAVQALNAVMVTDFSDFALAGMQKLSEIIISPSANIGKGLLFSDSLLGGVEGTPAILPALFVADCSAFDASSVAAAAVEVGPWALAGTHAETLTFKSLASVGEGAFAYFAGLKEIDARELGADLPSADSMAFDGLDPSSVRLIVTTDSEDLWRAHPVWGEFEIVPAHLADNAVDAVSGMSSGIEVSLRGGILSVSCPDGLESMALYSLDGKLLYSTRIDAEDFELDISTPGVVGGDAAVSTDSVIIAVFRTASEIRAVKLKL